MIYVLLFLLAAGFILFPIWRSKREQPVNVAQRSAHNKRVHAEQLQELKRDLADGKIDDAHFSSLEEELLAGFAATELAEHTQQSRRWSTVVLAISGAAVLLSVLLLYQQTGHRADFVAQRAIIEFSEKKPADAAERRADLLALLPTIEQRSAARPDNLSWRYLLAQMQSELQRYAEAAESYRHILGTDTNSAGVWAQYAQALYLRDARSMTADVQQALDSALKLNPHETTALGLQGMHAFENRDFARAAAAWEQLLAGLQPGSEQYQLISKARQRAQEELSKSSPTVAEGLAVASPSATPTSSPPAPAVTASADSIEVRVSLAEHIELPATTTVFVYARAAAGPKMPLAIHRLTLAELPTSIVLNDSMAMMPQMRLSMFDEIEVLARVSRSGSPSATSGDWQASSGTRRRDDISTPISLHIESQLP